MISEHSVEVRTFARLPLDSCHSWSVCHCHWAIHSAEAAGMRKRKPQPSSRWCRSEVGRCQDFEYCRGEGDSVCSFFLVWPV